MFNNKKQKVFTIVLIIFICIASVLNVVMASDIGHIQNCHNTHCLKCEMIHFCQIQIGLVMLSVTLMIAILVLLNKIKSINLIDRIKQANTLIGCKIQLNI